MYEFRVHAHRVVEDAREQQRYDQEQRRLGQCLAQKVHVRPVHSVVVLAQEYRELRTEHLNARHTIGRLEPNAFPIRINGHKKKKN